MARTAILTRETTETRVTVTLDLDGTGRTEISTGIGFLDHMLTALGRHALLDLTVQATGDLQIDAHHTTEDVGIVLGQALGRAVADKRGIRRYGHALVPMDEALIEAAIDLSGRTHLAWSVGFPTARVGEMDSELFAEFFAGFCRGGLINLHVVGRAGRNTHHMAEAAFKAVGRALRQAVEPDPRAADTIPSTKGGL